MKTHGRFSLREGLYLMLALAVSCTLDLDYHGFWERADSKENSVNKA